MKKAMFFAIPLTLFLVVSIFLFKGLFSNPRQLDSVVTDKPVPSFSLPDLFNKQAVYTQDIFTDKVTLLNVWGVWCVTCAVELPFLADLVEQEGIHIVGLYYDHDLDPEFGTKTLDEVQQEVSQMLARFGNPYAFQVFDERRDLSLDLGVTGAPEHFLIDKKGVVRWHHVGDVNEGVWTRALKPAIQALQAE